MAQPSRGNEGESSQWVKKYGCSPLSRFGLEGFFFAKRFSMTQRRLFPRLDQVLSGPGSFFSMKSGKTFNKERGT
jgi:hypothetical protein